MDKPGLDDDRRFEGGIFSGLIPEEEKQEQELDGERFFNYATLPRENQKRIPSIGPGSMEEREETREGRQGFLQPGTQEQETYRGLKKEPHQEYGNGSQESGNYWGYAGYQDTVGSQGYAGHQDTVDSRGYAGYQDTRGYQDYTGRQGTEDSQGYAGYQENRGYQGYAGCQDTGSYRGYAGRQGTVDSRGYAGYQENREYQGYTGHQGNRDYQASHWQGGAGNGRNAGFPPQYNYKNGGGCGSHKCMNCPNRGKQEHSAVIIMAIAAVTALVVAFLAVIFCLVKVSSYQQTQQPGGITRGEEEYYYGEQGPLWGDGGGWYEDIPEPYNGEDYYGEITDAIREDLDYSVTWENYEYEGNNENVMIAVDYPVISGDIPNIKAINNIIADETDYFESYYEEYAKYMLQDESFLVYSEGYVTYMDDDVMSVVFAEMVYTDYWTEYGLYCLNIDVENGVVLDNNSLVEINDEFAVDFRKRCKQQNGMVNDLEYMSDQEIAYYLSQGGTSILFYTPMGMEIGLNMGEYYVTVTYKDYEKFLRRY